MTYKEVAEFLGHFNHNSYNVIQIGNDKQLITKIYEYLIKMNIASDDIESIISHLAYMCKKNINIPLFLELITRSIGFSTEYETSEIIKVVKEIHDIYFKNAQEVLLEEYIHENEEMRLKKIFLNRNGKYIIQDYSNATDYLEDLKLATAIVLDTKEYNDFIRGLDSDTANQKNNSPFKEFRTYYKIREKLRGKARLFWDIMYANMYLVSLCKYNISINVIYKENVYSNKMLKKEEEVQLDLFTYQEDKEQDKINDIKAFQLCTVYNNKILPDYKYEKDYLLFYNRLLSNNSIILPKLKRAENIEYLYDVE